MQIEELHTERLILRKMDPETLEYMHQQLSDVELIRLLGCGDQEGLQKEKARYEGGMSTFNKKFLYFLIVVKEANKVIGWCGYHTWYFTHDRAELGYEIYSDEFKKKGYMSECIPPILAYGFNNMNLHRVEAMVEPMNVPSLRILEKAGFVKEGHMKEHYFKDNEYQDSLIFALLKKNYKRQDV